MVNESSGARRLIAVLAFVLGIGIVPHRTCERDASAWFDGEPERVEALARGVERWTRRPLAPDAFALHRALVPASRFAAREAEADRPRRHARLRHGRADRRRDPARDAHCAAERPMSLRAACSGALRSLAAAAALVVAHELLASWMARADVASALLGGHASPGTLALGAMFVVARVLAIVGAPGGARAALAAAFVRAGRQPEGESSGAGISVDDGAGTSIGARGTK